MRKTAAAAIRPGGAAVFCPGGATVWLNFKEFVFSNTEMLLIIDVTTTISMVTVAEFHSEAGEIH